MVEEQRKRLSRGKRIGIIIAVVVVVAAAVAGWIVWRQSLQDEPVGKPESSQTIAPAPSEEETDKQQSEDEPVSTTTAAQVREHANEISRKISDLYDYTVPGDQLPTYRYISVNGKVNSSGLTDKDTEVTADIKESLNWADSHTPEENDSRISLLDSDYSELEEQLWYSMGTCLHETVFGLEDQLESMDTDGLADSCKQASAMVDSMPDTDVDSEEGYVALRDWMNNVTAQLNQCQADMSAAYNSMR